MSPRRRLTAIAVLLLASLLPASPVLRPAPAAAAVAPTRSQGQGPLGDILYWADVYKCGDLTRDTLAAMIVVPTFTETGAASATTAPSPMTLSRYDTQDALYLNGVPDSTTKVFFHPGIGEWQWDSAGGWTLSAGTAIDTSTAAKQAAITMSTRYCASTAPTPEGRRASAWAPWYYCVTDPTPTRCETNYAAVLDQGVLNLASIAGIASTGGMEWRTCDVAGIGTVSCGYVDPTKAQGLKSFTAPNYGPAPLSAPFYVFEYGGKEYRYWESVDTGYATSYRAYKGITKNARTSLTWESSLTLCDRTKGRGDCQPKWSPVDDGGFTATPKGRVALGRNLDGRIEAFVVGVDGHLYHRWQVAVNSSWSPWFPLGGTFPAGTSPVVGRNLDGRLEVFAVAGDGRLYHSWQVVPNGSWSGFFPLGSPVGTVGLPAIGANLDGRQEVFVRAGDGKLWHAYQSVANGGWTPWFPLGGITMPAGGVPAVVTNADGRQQVAALGTDGRLVTLAQTVPNGGWTATSTLAGGPFVATANPALGRNADGRLEIVVAGDIYGVLYHAWQDTPGGAFGPFFLLGAASSQTPTVTLDLAGKLNIFIVGVGGALGVVRQAVRNGPWLPLATIGGAAATRPAVDLNVDTRLDLYATQANGAVLHAYQLTVPQ